jgi:hypothetical protein
MAFEILWEPQGICRRFWGIVTVAEFIDSVAQPRGDPRYDALAYVIYDFLDVVAHEITEHTIAGIAAVSVGDQAANSKLRVAVVTADDKVKVLAWLFASRTLASYPTRLFSNITDARAWLQSQPPLTKPRAAMHRPHPATEAGILAAEKIAS